MLEQGKMHEARLELERAAQLEPDMPETLYNLGKAALNDGDSEAAEKARTRLLSIEKQSPLAAQAHFGLAGLYRKQGKRAEAAHELEEYRKVLRFLARSPGRPQ